MLAIFFSIAGLYERDGAPGPGDGGDDAGGGQVQRALHPYALPGLHINPLMHGRFYGVNI